MQRLLNIFKDVWASLMFFTRLPLWRIYTPDAVYFRNVVGYWPLVGWLTGGLMAVVFAFGVHFFTLPVLVILVYAARILFTGALHEDGWADFCDGMGGGCTRERTLEIMKDSHIGTYGVLGLILYLMVVYFGLNELIVLLLNASLHRAISCTNPIMLTCMALITMDVWSKACASLIVLELPYARKKEEAKNKLVYVPRPWTHLLVTLLAMAPLCYFWWRVQYSSILLILLVPFFIQGILCLWLRKRLGGYTGDCCGATFVLSETFMLLAWLAIGI